MQTRTRATRTRLSVDCVLRARYEDNAIATIRSLIWLFAETTAQLFLLGPYGSGHALRVDAGGGLLHLMQPKGKRLMGATNPSVVLQSRAGVALLRIAGNKKAGSLSTSCLLIQRLQLSGGLENILERRPVLIAFFGKLGLDNRF